VLSEIRRILFHVDHGSGVGKRIVREVFRLANVEPFVGKVSFGKVVAINDTEHSGVDIQITTKPQISPIIGALALFCDCAVCSWFWQFVSLEKDSLRNSRILNAALNDVNGVVIEIVVDDTFADPIVLSGVFNYWLLEIGFEVEHLK